MDVYDILMRHRIVKSEMETALAQRAMDAFSQIHAFARNYLLERGTDAVDWEVANAARLWGMATAFPHPNQAFWSPIKPGDALQLAGVVRIGGYGGEPYRSFLVAPWTEWHERVWEVHAQSYRIQAAESYDGNSCSNVARGRSRLPGGERLRPSGFSPSRPPGNGAS